MAIPTITTMVIMASGLYRLMAWLSPAFPVGGFSYSHGLETAVEAGIVTDRESLRRYVNAVIAQGSGRSDAVLLAEVWRAVAADDFATFDEAAELGAALRGSSELALESIAQGQAFLATVRAAWPELNIALWIDRLADKAIQATYPVSVGLAASVAQVPLDQTVLAYLHAVAGGIVTAGVKLIPLGQTDGQRVVATLEPIIAETAAEACACTLADLGSAAPAVDLWSMQHETQYTRLFRS